MDPPNQDSRLGRPLDFAALPKSRRLPRHSRGQKFLWGPIPWSWIEAAMRLPGRSSDVGIILWQVAGMRKNRIVRFEHKAARSVGIERRAVSRALASLENAGLVEVERKPGRCPVVTLLDLNAQM